LALVMAIGSVLGAVGAPLFNAYSRRIEARADQYALDLTRDPTAVVATWRNLAVRGISDLEPHPLAQTWFGTHPAIPARIAHARPPGHRHPLAHADLQPQHARRGRQAHQGRPGDGRADQRGDLDAALRTLSDSAERGLPIGDR